MKKIITVLLFALNFCFSQKSIHNLDSSNYGSDIFYESGRNQTQLLDYKFNDSLDRLFEETISSDIKRPITQSLGSFSSDLHPEINLKYSLDDLRFQDILFTRDSLSANTSSWSKVDKTKFYILTGSLLGAGVFFHFTQQNAWWKGIRGPFNIKDDWDYACQLDKAGHFYGGMITARTVMECYSWTGVNRNTSIWIGAACGAAWQTYVEIEDGFSLQWGFSPTDFASDLLGAFYPVAQEYWEPLRAINLKFSYLPSSDLSTGTWKKGIYAQPTFVQKSTIIDDYQGQMFWLTVNVNYFLPRDYKKYWPDWLQIALGYGLSKWDGDQEAIGRKVTDKELWLSFDYDIEKLPGDTEFLRLVKKLFNQFHLPAPAIRLTPGPIWYGLFFAHGL